jgi:hypothetical protein
MFGQTDSSERSDRDQDDLWPLRPDGSPPPQPPPPKPRRRRRFPFALLVVVILAILACALVARFGPGLIEGMQSLPTAAPTATPRPTDTPDSPWPATWTPVPSRTPTATPTPTPTPVPPARSSGSSSSSRPRGPVTPLSIDFTRDSVWCTSGHSYVAKFTIRAQGGDGYYTYFRDIDKIAGPVQGEVSYEVPWAECGGAVGTFFVESAGQRVSKKFWVSPPSCCK